MCLVRDRIVRWVMIRKMIGLLFLGEEDLIRRDLILLIFLTGCLNNGYKFSLNVHYLLILEN